MYFEIYRYTNLIIRGKKWLGTLQFDHELNLAPTLTMVLPATWYSIIKGREEIKIHFDDGKVFWGIIWNYSPVDKVNETMTLDIRHVITEWQYRQISVNHAISNKALNIVYKGDEVETSKSNAETITASGFTIGKKEAEDFTNAKILSRSRAYAWNTTNGDKVAITSVKIQKCETDEDDKETKAAEEFEIENGILLKYLGSAGEAAVPDGVKVIGKNAFSRLSALKKVTIPDSVTEIGESAFFDCRALTDVTIPDSVTGIGKCAFGDCDSLANLQIPAGVTAIGASAFDGCTALRSIYLPNGITRIGNRAFAASGLTSLEIPSTVTAVNDFAFAQCNSLTSITVRAANPPGMGSNACFTSETYASALLKVPEVSLATYQSAFWWKLFQNINKLFIRRKTRITTVDIVTKFHKVTCFM